MRPIDLGAVAGHPDVQPMIAEIRDLRAMLEKSDALHNAASNARDWIVAVLDAGDLEWRQGHISSHVGRAREFDLLITMAEYEKLRESR